MGRDGFDPRLESLRGIAALAVAWTHGNAVFLPTSVAQYPLLGQFRNWVFLGLPAGAAVVLFFALSGHVLGLALIRDSNYIKFATRRLFRIFPALWVGVAATFAVQQWILVGLAKEDFSEWFQNVYLLGPGWADFARNLILAKVSIDPVIWSLRPEVVCSLVLPLVVYIHFKTNLVGRGAILAFMVAYGHHASRDMVQYAATFYAGFFAPRELIAPILKHRFMPAILALAGYLILCAGNQYGIPYTPTMREFCTLGAVLLIGGVIASPDAMKWLALRPLRFLGRVSYSFYLLHLPVLYLLAALVSNFPDLKPESVVGGTILAITSIMLALPIAAACHALVEIPAITIGRSVGPKIIDLLSRRFDINGFLSGSENAPKSP